MSCPICGANCRCKKAGPGGICCSCHKHKARKLLDSLPDGKLNLEIREALERHLRAIEDEKRSLFREVNA